MSVSPESAERRQEVARACGQAAAGLSEAIAIFTITTETIMLTPDEREMRARLLELATRQDVQPPVKLATEYLAFVTGTSDRTPRETIDATLNEAGIG